ncbi:MAG: HAD family hydrolase [Opitutaceae bacterium]|nr:HAD family hydrolase [Opitutaceae bacterium]
MKIRAVIFDLYGTLLEIGPPPADADRRWTQAWKDGPGTAPRLDLAQFDARCRQVVAAEHAAARARGIPYPEVYWPDVVDAVLPEFARLPAAQRTGASVYQADFMRAVRLMPGAANVLRAAQRAQLHLGLASNCQPYTLGELDDALAGAGLSRDLFDPRISFLSFQQGFSKPDPHVFRLLTARLRTLGIEPGEAVMVGDRADNDIAPARAHGWQTCQIGPQTDTDWERLVGWFSQP